MILVPTKNIWTLRRKWGQPKFQRGIICATAIYSDEEAILTISGESVIHQSFGPTGPTIAGIRVNTDGTIDKREGSSYTQIDSSTDWLIPNGDADSTYEFRITGVTFTIGSTWFVEAATEDTWINMASNREWSVRDNSDTPTDDKLVSFTLEGRKGSSGSALDTGAFTLTSEWEDTV